MDASSAGRLERIFAAILRARWLFVVLYGLLLPPAAFLALKVGQDNSLDRLIVPSDPDFIATRDFQQVFGAGEFSLDALIARRKSLVTDAASPAWGTRTADGRRRAA